MPRARGSVWSDINLMGRNAKPIVAEWTGEVGVTVPETSLESNGASVLATKTDLHYSPCPCWCSVCPICGMPPPR
jgi:hypothetical protein